MSVNVDLGQRSSYSFELPSELIAQHPVNPRDASRLMVVHRQTGTIEHRRFSEISEILDANDVCVANNTRVIPARLLGQRIGTGGKIEFVLLEQTGPLEWEGLIRSGARAVRGFHFEAVSADGQRRVTAEIIQGTGENVQGTVIARFDRDPIDAEVGALPLPPYIERQSGVSPEDLERYQTVYSKKAGSAAAPTAGLHFTEGVRERLAAKGVDWLEVTLHVGLGTFRPVKVDRLSDHPMHEERYEVDADVAKALTDAKARGKRLLAVGTTSVRTLESIVRVESGVHRFESGSARTSIFIRPGVSEFRAVDRLLTNFHLPESTLIMLVSAFAGYELTMRAYQEAVAQRYRFYSYGDAMLIV